MPPADGTDKEVALAGGMGSGGAVVRVGDTVRRPVGPFTPAVRALLGHFERVGFRGAPRWRGTDDRGRDVLDFVDGDVGIPPYPPWTADDDLVVSVATLQRDAHRAARDFRPPESAAWQDTMVPDALRGTLVCHNDLCVGNVVVRDGRAVAFIDWDFAAPVDPLLDIAIAARHWVPLRDATDLDESRADVDRIARFGTICDVHELPRPQRVELVDAALAFLDQALASMRSRAQSGLPHYVAAWDAGYEGQNRRSHAWVLAERAALTR